MRRNSVRAPPSDAAPQSHGPRQSDAAQQSSDLARHDDAGQCSDAAQRSDGRQSGDAGQRSDAGQSKVRGTGARRADARRKLLVIASGNPGKLREFRELLADLPFEVIAQSELNLTTPEETGASFLENALLKARHAAMAAGAAAIADDSGLEVDALGGAPGIHSARYAGAGADDAANNAKLLATLAGTPPNARGARYRCALVFVDGALDSVPLTAEGVWEGSILDSPRGTGGFGYDPYFWVAELNASAAELSLADKNRRSHRGAALRALRAQLVRREQSALRAQEMPRERPPERGA
jgi:XTP/dITP diphosphohydrolase